MEFENISKFMHIGFGTASLVLISMQVLLKKGTDIHRTIGRIALICIVLSLTASCILAIETDQIFLLLVALFTGYLFFSAFRYLKAKSSIAIAIDIFAAILLFLVGIVLTAVGFINILNSNSFGIAAICFGGIACALSITDLIHNLNPPEHDVRIILHMSRMSAGTIAMLTAVFVINVQTNPEFIAWITPTLLFSPIIIYSTRR